MEEALQPLDEADHPIKPNTPFIMGIAASVILHLAFTALLLGLPGGGSPARQSITYVDLGAAPAPVPMTPPAREAIPERDLLEPETPSIPEAPPAPQDAALPEQPEPLPRQTAAQQEVSEERSSTILGLGLTKGYFKSLGDGETLRDDIKGYYLEMLQGINEKWWLDQDQKQVNPIVVNITVARNGEIVGSDVVVSSGNPRYDRAVQRSLKAAGPLPPLPDSYHGDFFQAPIRLVPPLNLMAW